MTGAGQVAIASGKTLTNAVGQTLTLASTSPVPLGGAGTFTNAGTFDKTVAGISQVTAAFNNTGTVNVDNGTLQLLAGGIDTGSYAIDAGATLTFAGGTRTLTGGGISGAGNVTFGSNPARSRYRMLPATTWVEPRPSARTSRSTTIPPSPISCRPAARSITPGR
jgi:hypothetical protein